ncbi:hypothetical protein HYFRA_00011898 [Hymenoscyphus fraxineus]|uniref:Uncharacterized protein n=1 Tax=Hymenoscyphus fraxineus TaxID=746836 RepID=A0A9N9L0V6_9HELO|nr:hypothetical protein HYFRA_00011898 [Hymenoscyphus fraxineus]
MLFPNICAATAVLSTLVAGYPLTANDEILSQLSARTAPPTIAIATSQDPSLSKRVGPISKLFGKKKEKPKGPTIDMINPPPHSAADLAEIARIRKVLNTKPASSAKKPPSAAPADSQTKLGRRSLQKRIGPFTMFGKFKMDKNPQLPVFGKNPAADKAEIERIQHVLDKKFGKSTKDATRFDRPLYGAEAEAQRLESARAKASLDAQLSRKPSPPKAPSGPLKPLYGNDAARERRAMDQLKEKLSKDSGLTRLEDIPVSKSQSLRSRPRPGSQSGRRPGSQSSRRPGSNSGQRPGSKSERRPAPRPHKKEFGGYGLAYDRFDF